jgi:hypothetical protein
MSPKVPKLTTVARKARSRTKRTLAKIPGPSTNPATNLLILDVAVRGASLIAGRAMERALLRTRYQREKAHDIVKGRTMVKSLAYTGVARVATRSVPGFLLVAGGLFAKAVIDRSLSRRESVRRGERELAEQAAQADETIT